VGGLSAWATEPWIDPAGGTTSGRALNVWGHPAARFFGVELDGAVGYRAPFAPLRTVGVGLEGGVLLPGDALEGLSRGPVGRIEARVDVAF
jgi:hypothetical protein